MAEQIRFGVIGGSGVYQMEALQDVREVTLDTPFGAPSDSYTVGSLHGQQVAFLARHGRGHRISPRDSTGAPICTASRCWAWNT